MKRKPRSRVSQTNDEMLPVKKSRNRLSRDDEFQEVRESSVIKTLNFAQDTYLNAIKSKNIIFGAGPAGTGKTYVATSYAALQLLNKKVDKIILTRPNVEVGRSLGFLPGSLEEKYAPYLEPFSYILKQRLGEGFYDYCLKTKTIDPRPLGFMRGSNFENVIVLVDECQNMTKIEFRMLLSRIGNNTKIILSGDLEQMDIPDSGMLDAIERLERVTGIEVCRFLDADIVRSVMCKKIICAYREK